MTPSGEEPDSGSGTGQAPCVQDSPEQLIGAVLAACRSGGKALSATLWEHGSEKLRNAAGDREHLEHLLGNDLFAPLVSAANVWSHSSERIEDSLRSIVSAEDERGGRASYLLAVSRSSHGNRAGCWLVTGLERVQEA